MSMLKVGPRPPFAELNCVRHCFRIKMFFFSFFNDERAVKKVVYVPLLMLTIQPFSHQVTKDYKIFRLIGQYLKFFFSHRTTGLYTKTLAKIIYRDLTRFLVVFAVVFVAFCGALFLSLKATDSQELFR